MNKTNMENRMIGLKQKWERINLAFPAYFWSRVKVGQIGDCWVWTGTIGSNGYGQVVRVKKNVSTHRAAYELMFGAIEKGLYVCHHCDNKPCCNPFHLYAGTPAENTKDAVDRGLVTRLNGIKNPMFGKRGEQSPCSKYTNEQIIEIRRKYATGAYTQKSLSKEYGTTQCGISQIIRRATWNHI